MKAARVLVADPPWQFGDALPGNGRGAVKHYECMSLIDLMFFNLPPIADDALLFLWRVAAIPEEPLRIARAWGFEPKAELVWVKTPNEETIDRGLKRATRSEEGEATAFTHGFDMGRRVRIGMGHYVRNAHETCIIARRGKANVADRSVPSVFFAPRGEHSAKPDAFYEIVEALSPGPYAELFARRRRPGWRCFGNELPPA